MSEQKAALTAGRLVQAMNEAEDPESFGKAVTAYVSYIERLGFRKMIAAYDFHGCGREAEHRAELLDALDVLDAS